MSVVCPSCGQETPEGFPRCANCGAALAADAAPAREERKVVTVLFCDLVGSTARAEGADPEDVRSLLSSYHERVRAELERFGGTVEKFIGDAVMALFGAPTAHEDDPERAVRAALAIRDWASEDGDLQVRIGITTGEALVALGARPEAGEGMASGDVVNTAARLESAARVNGIVVDETTYRATERLIEFGEREEVEAKGKTAPVPVWEALQARARVQVERVERAALVGREKELEVLLGALERMRDDREPQLVTLVGVPGIGKSRLVYELFKSIETGGELTFWRHGRSLPYGEGVSFWALGEIVKAQAGVLETDDAAATETKLRETIASFVTDSADADWIERHLRPLMGLEAGSELSPDRRGEAFAAWRRFLEALAAHRPLVVVFEDLHFADDGLLDFVDYLVDWASGVPMLVVGTARPELLSRRPGWGGGKANVVTLSLPALSDEDTARLVHSLLERPVLDVELQELLIDRAGGNPLYAEEFARMLEERGQAEDLPETVQGLVAARLDGLPPEEKALLQDAAVLGKTFWLGAAVALRGIERWAAEEQLHALERKEFVRRERRSAVAGENEYAFRHQLVRDVAYGQIPRGARVDRHRKAAQWIESLGRAEDHAEMLAHHYLGALELSRTAGQSTRELTEPARVALREAGDRALGLNAFSAAARYYGEALELWPPDDLERPDLLLRLARARHLTTHELSERTLEEARDALLASGRPEQAAEAETLLAELSWHRGDRKQVDLHLDHARSLVAGAVSSPANAHVLSQIARYRALAGDIDEAIRIGQEALAMAELFGLDELQAHALINVSIAKVRIGDTGAIADLERSVEIALAVRSPDAARALNNLAASVSAVGDYRRSLALFGEAVRVGEELGALRLARFSRAQLALQLIVSGYWSEGSKLADEFVAEIEAGEPSYAEAGIRRIRARVRFGRGDVGGALEEIDRAVALAREIKDPQVLGPAFSGAARIYAELGREEEARSLLDELLSVLPGTGEWKLVDSAFVAERLGRRDELRKLLEDLPLERFRRTLLAVLDGEYEVAADLFHEIGAIEYEADARLRAAEKLFAEGRRAEADAQAQRSLAFWRSAEATRHIRECETLLAESA
jgi:class 3 adenylate cyclase/tetratricopeptide (TPR) repeat protein